ncbi:hypothetical protein AA313_de0206055 [Arthrobotrys entomopaga]|nr:hypothetical protein AA313_de0206055 [Arthrobotrys entomopaga]
MSTSKPTFTTLPAEIHTIIFSYIEAHYWQENKIQQWKNDPLPDEIKHLALINREWRRLVIGRKFRLQTLRQFQDVQELADFTANHPVVAASLRDLTVFVCFTDFSKLWVQILKWAEEGINLHRLVVRPFDGQTQVAGTQEGGKYTLYEFADLANLDSVFSAPIAIEKLELNTSIMSSEDEEQVLQLGAQSMDILLGRLKTTTALRLNVDGMSRSRRFLRTTYEATCGYLESIMKFQNQNQSLTNLTALQLDYGIVMSRQPYNTSTRSFYLDEQIDERGDNLSNILRKLSKRLKTVLIHYDRVTSEIFESIDGTSDGETEDWPYLNTFHLIFSDMDAYGYRRSELRTDAPEDTEDEEEEEEEFEEEELEFIDFERPIPKNDNDGFDWLNPDVIDSKVIYKDDRYKRIATSGVRSFYLSAAKAVANKMPAIQSFKMTMDLSVNNQVYMEYANQPHNPKLVIIGDQIVEPQDLPENEGEEGNNELVRIFKQGVGEDVKIKYNFSM